MVASSVVDVCERRSTEAIFWFMMQIGMIFGFFTSYPANIFLLKSGWKEEIPLYETNRTMFEILNEPSGKIHAADEGE